ncbi:MAG: hypothetical protein HYS13_23230 [Planctomycetia bacterium]|nr:hypothetical protein [Planctomycetia bacterium]
MRRLFLTIVAATAVLMCAVVRAEVVPCDLSAWSPKCGVQATREGNQLAIAWPMSDVESGRVVLNLQAGRPLIAEIAVENKLARKANVVLKDADPAFFLTVGERRVPAGKPPDQFWQTFFDAPASRPHETHAAKLDLASVNVTSAGRRATVSIGDLVIGDFSGTIELTFFPNCRVFQITAVVSTKENGRAILYDAALAGDGAGWKRIAWMDAAGKMQSLAWSPEMADRPEMVRHRTVIAETAGGSIACFSPPHQFQFPRDFSTNHRFVWFGRNHLGLEKRFALGIRQEKTGGNNFVPWFNAPPATKQRLSVFYLLTSGKAEDAFQETLRFTNGDRFPELPGYLTMTSHWHMAVAVTAMQREKPIVPEFVGMFKDMNVNMVHLGEFHGDGHQKDGGLMRLREMETMFGECRRLSDDRLLLIPGEEVNTFLGLEQPGKHPGHWMSLFPKPVYWFMQREKDQPFVVDDAKYGKMYRVGSREDMSTLIEAEGALVWAAHPRIKASSWTPDIFRQEDFYLADSWLGGAWKAMPGDLSEPRLGTRVLDLLDDMANWGQKKYVLGEVDVFKIDRTHELYGHMNINYLKMDKLPRFDDGWQEVLDVLRGGRFFVTTGEVLIPSFSVGGKESGQTLKLPADGKPELKVDLQWTFPLSLAEVISGDGQKVYRERIDLSDTEAFGRRTISLRPKLRGRKWVRLEVWDTAVNGAFTQPVWLEAN